jgi:hypothetical protein
LGKRDRLGHGCCFGCVEAIDAIVSYASTELEA